MSSSVMQINLLQEFPEPNKVHWEQVALYHLWNTLVVLRSQFDACCIRDEQSIQGNKHHHFVLRACTQHNTIRNELLDLHLYTHYCAPCLPVA